MVHNFCTKHAACVTVVVLCSCRSVGSVLSCARDIPAESGCNPYTVHRPMTGPGGYIASARRQTGGKLFQHCRSWRLWPSCVGLRVWVVGRVVTRKDKCAPLTSAQNKSVTLKTPRNCSLLSTTGTLSMLFSRSNCTPHQLSQRHPQTGKLCAAISMALRTQQRSSSHNLVISIRE